MESRNVCVVKYVGHRIYKDIRPLVKIFAILLGLLAIIAGFIIASWWIATTYGADTFYHGMAWALLIGYIVLTAAVSDNMVDRAPCGITHGPSMVGHE